VDLYSASTPISL